MKACPNWKAVMIAEKDAGLLVARSRCKMWACPYCSHILRRGWKTIMIDGIQTLGGGWSFVTLTAHENAHKAGKTLENLRGGWRRWLERLRRKYGTIHYVRIYEKHTSGAFHIHAIFNAKIARRWAKDAARNCGMGYQVDVRQIGSYDAPLAAIYIAKYLTKEAQENFPANIRRVQLSRGFPKIASDDAAAYDWAITHGISEETWMAYEWVYDVSIKAAVTADDFTTDTYYPPDDTPF